MDIKFVSSLSVTELEELPSGAVLSFGTANAEKVGSFWLFSKYDYTAEQHPAVVSKEMYMIIDEWKSEHEGQNFFSLIIPPEQEEIAQVTWLQEDIAIAFENMDVDMTPDRYFYVKNVAKNDLEDAMVDAGWEFLYGAVMRSANTIGCRTWSS